MSQGKPSPPKQLTWFIIAVFSPVFVSSLRVDVVPDTVVELVTDTVTVTCDVTNTPYWTADNNIMLMEVGKRGEQPLATLGKTRIEYGANKKANMEADGHIDEGNTIQSYLRLTITNPGVGDGGVYVCRLYFVDGFDELQDYKEYGNMTVDVSSQVTEQAQKDSMLQVLRNLTQNVASLEDRVAHQEKELQEQEELLKELQGKETFTSAFNAAYSPHDKMVDGKTLRFRQALVNIGSDYNTTTGVYTAPRHGVYVFYLVATASKSKDYAYIQLMAKDQILAMLYASDSDSLDQSSVAAVASLEAGDRVRPVVFKHRGSQSLRSRLTSFNGYMLRLL